MPDDIKQWTQNTERWPVYLPHHSHWCRLRLITHHSSSSWQREDLCRIITLYRLQNLRTPIKHANLHKRVCNNSTYIHTPFNGPFSGTIQVSRYQKGKTSLDFTEASDSKWQWHQLGHMQVCTSLQTDNHASTPPLSFLLRDAMHPRY